MKDPFEVNLPWFVNGTLDPAEAAEMERHIAEHPEAAEQLAAYRRFSAAVAEQWRSVPGELPGFARVMDRIRTEQNQRGDTFWRRLSTWFGTGGIAPRLVGAAALVVVAVQAALIGVLHRDLRALETHYAQYRSSAGVAEVGPFIWVSFRPEATEFDIRMLLVGLGASYVGGPSQLGDYYVFVQREHADRAVERLNASHLVEAAALVAKVPTLE